MKHRPTAPHARRRMDFSRLTGTSLDKLSSDLIGLRLKSKHKPPLSAEKPRIVERL